MARSVNSGVRFLRDGLDMTDPRDATIERLRAELAASAASLELAATYLHRTEYPGIAGRCAAAARRAREGAER